MKRLFMFFAMSIAMISSAIERPSSEWNAMVTKCAFDVNAAAEQIKKLDNAKQPLFAVDVIKAITLYPNPRERILARIVEAIEKMSSTADPKISFVVQMMSIDAIPNDFKNDAIFLLNKRFNENRPISIHQTPNGNPVIINAYMSTNYIDKTEYIPQSDIGILRVPRSMSTKDRKDHKDRTEPMPYWMQHL